MQLFYAPDLTKDSKLPLEESKHCLKILRHQVGDSIQVTDGKGFFYECEITSVQGNLKILKANEDTATRPYYLHIAVAPTKNGERTDWMIEKLVEFGIDEITFLQCEHSERNKINLERCDRVAIAAMKQSLKSHAVKINDLTNAISFFTQAKESTKLIAHCNTSLPRGELKLLSSSKKIVCCIGPEGDFSNSEIDAALHHGFEAISLGMSRLRTETAAMAVCGFYYFESGKGILRKT